jgi:hypothetical protein
MLELSCYKQLPLSLHALDTLPYIIHATGTFITTLLPALPSTIIPVFHQASCAMPAAAAAAGVSAGPS